MSSFDLNKWKQKGEALVDKVKKSGVIDRVTEGVKEGIGTISSKLRSTMPLEIKENMSKVQITIHEIVEKKQAGDDNIDGLIRQAEQDFLAVISACRVVKKIEQAPK
ncbi:MAG: hypothetical protein AABY34_01670 [Pseudomonadota bacterium]